MRSPRLIYLAAAAVLLVAALALTDWLTDRSVPDLGDGVVLPAGASAAPTTPAPKPPTPTPVRTTPTKATPTKTTTAPPARRTTGADPVTPAPARTAGQDDDLDDDGVDDDLDDRTDSDGDG